jgi:5-methylcytosine-specific restriction protein A
MPTGDLVNEQDFHIPEEVEDATEFYEGAQYQDTINAYERSAEARQKCISHYGVNCSICGFSFEKAYGEAAKDLIHVHHLRQLSDIGSEYKVDPVRDMCPVCPNCHAVIHRRKTVYTIEEVKAMLHKSKQISNKDRG